MFLILALIILAFCIIYLLYILFRSSRKPSPYRKLKEVYSLPKLTIPLEELAHHLWLKTEKRKTCQVTETVFNISEKTVQDLSKSEKTEVSDENLPFLTDEILFQIWNDIVLPYKEEIQEQKVLDLVKEGLNILYVHGNCPSLTGVSEKETFSDVETEDYALYKDILVKTTLKEHTVNVIRITVDIVKQSFENHEKHIPRMLIIALYHDLGKIPEYQKIYGAKAHPLISANLLGKIASETQNQPFWLDEAIQIIREHHIPGEQNPLKRILTQADKKARLIEISKTLSNYKIAPLEEWFSVEELISDLSQVTNLDHYGPKWYAFSHNDVVYVKPDKLVELIDEQRKRKNILSPDMLTAKDKTLLIPKIVTFLKEKGLLAYFKPDQQVNRIPKFRIYLKDGKSHEVLLIPIKITAFSEDQIQQIKNRLPASYFSAIAEIKLLSK